MELTGADLGPAEGMKILPALLTTWIGRRYLTL